MRACRYNMVAVGGALAASAGATMEEVVSRVLRVARIVGEISAAGNEQEAGIEQINQAIIEMDAVTQQNAAPVEASSVGASGGMGSVLNHKVSTDCQCPPDGDGTG